MSVGSIMMEGVFGAVSNIISLYSDVKISEIVDLLTRHVFDELKKTHTGVKICNPAAKKIESGQSILKIDSRFEKILNNQDWTWDKILADAQHMCGTSDVVLDVSLPRKTVQHFQVCY
jgi:hypothetical protein